MLHKDAKHLLKDAYVGSAYGFLYFPNGVHNAIHSANWDTKKLAEKVYEVTNSMEEAEKLYNDMHKLYDAFKHMKAVQFEKEWVEVETIHYADNSIEVIKKNVKTGEKKAFMKVAPHGDACY